MRPRDAAILQAEGAEIEACRQIALRLRSELRRHAARSAAVISAVCDEGKTTTSCNLAIALASLSAERNVALVDLDLRRPSVLNVLGLEADVGIERVLARKASLDEARVPVSEPALDVYPVVTPQRSAHELLSHDRLEAVVAALEQRYETVIFDTPPMLHVPDGRLILEQVSVCVPVARAGRTRVRSFREMIAALPRGVVVTALLNGSRAHARYYQGYDYQQGVEGVGDELEEHGDLPGR